MTLRERLNRAETAEEIARICCIEAHMLGGPLWCSCGKEYCLPPLHATVDMAEAAAKKYGITLSEAASVYRTMVEAR